MIELDVRGLSCPLPVIQVRGAITANPGQAIAVLIDTMVTIENVTRMAENLKYTVEEPKPEGEDYRLVLKPSK